MSKKENLQQRLSQLPLDCFQGAMIGVEKESLRICHDGFISHAAHPYILGSPLTHSCITTDFSEALLEIITPPYTNSREVLKFLTNTEAFVRQQLPNEYLWPASMPCSLRGEDDIPIAHYGHSSLGKMKTIYRRGLAHRYGKIMQVIAGAHFNYSFPSNLWTELQIAEKQQGSISHYINQKYMALIRNIQRYGWLNLYLFGASPAISRTFVNKEPENLSQFDKDTYFNPHATSLRMSKIGYTNHHTHRYIEVSYDSLEAYIRTLGTLINTPHAAYKYIDNNSSNEPQQLNNNILQIENEYYTTVRPKQISHGNESHFKALQERGIGYVELRSLDINPFCIAGVEHRQLDFLEVFMYYCQLKDSSMIDQLEAMSIKENQSLVATEGRNPQLRIHCGSKKIRMQECALEIMDEMQSVVTKLDDAHNTSRYSQAVAEYQQMVLDSQLTPSARILSEMLDNKESFTDFAMRKSIEHHKYYQNIKLDDEHYKYYESLSSVANRQQQKIESVDKTIESVDRLILSSVNT